MPPHVARLRVYPFKSFDGVDVERAEFVERGALRWDRAFAFVDSDGGYVNAKREEGVHRVRVTYDPGVTRATFATAHDDVAYAFGEAPAALEAFLTRTFGRDVRLQRDDAGGFPDDLRAPGPTIVSVATLETVASWFDGMTADDVRRRLRTNIEVDGVPAFWEDRLFGAAETVLPFRVGSALLGGTNPCARCVVPSRDATTGEAWPLFQKHVAERRAATLPAWADRSRFDHFYRLTVNTRTLDGAGPIRVGDPVELAEAPEAVR